MSVRVEVSNLGQLRSAEIEGWQTQNTAHQRVASAGLNLICNRIEGLLTGVRPQAYLVAAKQCLQLKNLLRSGNERLQFGSSKLPLLVRRYGDSVEVGTNPDPSGLEL